MPHSITYRPTLIDSLITNERITSYQKVFNTQNDVELVGAYLWNIHVCSSIYPLISAAEITLRNSIDKALREKLGSYWWSGAKLKYNSFVSGDPAPRAVKIVSENFTNAYNNVVFDKRSRYKISGKIIPTHNEMIAKTDFSTWENILDNEFMGNNLIWPSKLGSVFTGTWPSQQASITLKSAQDLVATIREFRNRIFHYEPAWKKYGIRNETDAIKYLHEKIQKIESLIELISPEKLKLLNINGVIQTAYRACSPLELKRFKYTAEKHGIKSIEELTNISNSCNTENSVYQIDVNLDGQYKLLIYPASKF